MGRTVLVAGVSRYLGGRFARLLSADPTVSRVIGVDVVPPPHDIGDAEFVRADIRNPVIAKVIASAAAKPSRPRASSQANLSSKSFSRYQRADA